MRLENSNNQKSDLQETLKMLWWLESGVFDSIECPRCHAKAVSAWFTIPATNEYRTWFVCTACGYETRAQNNSKPVMFREDRVHAEYQKRDEEMEKNRKFPKPG